MATRRRIGVSAASTEAARRQLMQPVPCWERVLATPENAAPGSTLKIWKWVRTDKLQHFSDDEGGVDEPLAPLPDEPEVVDGDEEGELEDANANVGITNNANAKEAAGMEDSAAPEEPPSKPASPKPQLKMTLEEGNGDEIPNDGLEASLKPMEDIHTESGGGKQGVGLDVTVLGPDGLSLRGASNLTQMDADDHLVGGPLLDQTGDPFRQPAS